MVSDQLLSSVLAGRPISNLDRQKVRAALTTLLSVVGEDFLSTGGSTEPLGRLVQVPGDSARWVVFHDNIDGTCDIIRESGTIYSRDILTEWKPGQSISDYMKIIEAVKIDPLAPEDEAKPMVRQELLSPSAHAPKKQRKTRAKADTGYPEKAKKVMGLDFYGEYTPGEEDEEENR